MCGISLLMPPVTNSHKTATVPFSCSTPQSPARTRVSQNITVWNPITDYLILRYGHFGNLITIPATLLHIFGCQDRVPIPVVVCGNNCGSPRRAVHPPMIRFHREKGLQYYDFSVRELFNFHKPLQYLARRVFGREMVSRSSICRAVYEVI